jgi:hypothetical protein
MIDRSQPNVFQPGGGESRVIMRARTMDSSGRSWNDVHCEYERCIMQPFFAYFSGYTDDHLFQFTKS